MIFESLIFFHLFELLPFLSLLIDLRIFGLIELLEEHLHQFFVIPR